MKKRKKVLIILSSIFILIILLLIVLIFFNQNKSYEKLIEGVDIDEMYEYDEKDISYDGNMSYINNIIILSFEDGVANKIKAKAINSIQGKVVGGDIFYNDLYIEIEPTDLKHIEEICDKLNEIEGVYAYSELILNENFSNIIKRKI